MDRKELVEKKAELEGKITELNEKLRFGSSGDMAGINAIAQMKENLKLVEAALVDMPVEDVPTHDAAEEVPDPAVVAATTVPPVVEEPIIEPAPEGIEAQLGTGE